jgi:DNA-binding transcriptional ArsR family regulator
MAEAASVKQLDPASLKGLAHPLRMRLLAALRLDGPATSAGLARRFGETTGATSYHLRQLARHGFVEEEAGRGTARERWWKASHRNTQWRTSPFMGDSTTAEAADFLLRYQLEREVRLVQRWLHEQQTWPTEWIDASDSSDYVIRLSVAQLAAMSAEIGAVLRRYQDEATAEATDTAEAADQPETEQVALFFRAFPQRGALE